ncbi:MAG: hypothetical protein JWQ40_2908 [Segetibacter sp.]|nr:hypothetical protein [Segetibacter sp.]
MISKHEEYPDFVIDYAMENNCLSKGIDAQSVTVYLETGKLATSSPIHQPLQCINPEFNYRPRFCRMPL